MWEDNLEDRLIYTYYPAVPFFGVVRYADGV